MLVKVDTKRKGQPVLKVAGKIVKEAMFKKRYFCQHSQLYKSIFVITESDESKPVVEQESKNEDQGEVDNREEQS